jgi:hypothetical protein
MVVTIAPDVSPRFAADRRPPLGFIMAVLFSDARHELIEGRGLPNGCDDQVPVLDLELDGVALVNPDFA